MEGPGLCPSKNASLVSNSKLLAQLGPLSQPPPPLPSRAELVEPLPHGPESAPGLPVCVLPVTAWVSPPPPRSKDIGEIGP